MTAPTITEADLLFDLDLRIEEDGDLQKFTPRGRDSDGCVYRTDYTPHCAVTYGCSYTCRQGHHDGGQAGLAAHGQNMCL